MPRPWPSQASSFNPRSPCGERPSCDRWCTSPSRFNPRSPCGERRHLAQYLVPSEEFQPTLPLRGATDTSAQAAAHHYVSTHAPLAGSDGKSRGTGALLRVSTHAPLAGSDVRAFAGLPRRLDVSTPRSPCGGATSASATRSNWLQFQPTPPCGERPAPGRSRSYPTCFNPRSPCGERLVYRANWWLRSVFQPTLFAGSDQLLRRERARAFFQPTLPLRGATDVVTLRPRAPAVSTHAPLAGSDHDARSLRVVPLHVSTHAPLRGATDNEQFPAIRLAVSTHAPLAGSDFCPECGAKVKGVSTHAPLAGSDASGLHVVRSSQVSTHAPLAGSDATCRTAPWPRTRFNPRSPCGERRSRQASFVAPLDRFQPTLPLRGATQAGDRGCPGQGVSTHAPLAGSDHTYTSW